jgi:segregation and condensation protein B
MKMGVKEDVATIEAALYAADRPLTLTEIKKLVGTTSETYVRKLMDDLISSYQGRGGPLVLVETAKNVFTLRLRDEYMQKLEDIMPKERISRGALKTLALIAYKQPVFQAKLALMRSGRVYEHIKQLVSLGFVESKPFGRTRVLRTSKKFASYFGIEDDMDKIREKLEEMMR